MHNCDVLLVFITSYTKCDDLYLYVILRCTNVPVLFLSLFCTFVCFFPQRVPITDDKNHCKLADEQTDKKQQTQRQYWI